MELAHAFHREEAELERLNCSFVVMIAKHNSACRAGNCRPICLQNCSLKIIAKMLTARLQVEISRIIDVDQTGFIKGRSISENFIYAMELVQCCNKRKLSTLVLKLDFAKALTQLIGTACKGSWRCTASRSSGADGLRRSFLCPS